MLSRRVAAPIALVALFFSSRASAHGDSDRDAPVRSHPESAATATEEAGDGETHFTVGIDLVIGLGKTLAANQIPPGSLGVNPVNEVFSDPVDVDSFIFSFGYKPFESLGFGVRVPLTVGSLNPDGYQSRTEGILGNIEVEGEYEARLSPTLSLALGLGLALPTAQGTEVPESTADLSKNFNQGSYDQYSLAIAAASARGFEDNALFIPGRFGIVPKVSLAFHAPSGLSLEPYVKLENLASTSSDNSKSYIGELVFGARGGYRVGKYFEPGLRLWSAIAFAGPDTGAVGVVEPEARFHVGTLTPYLGVVIPFAGSLAKDPSQFVGIRVGAAFAF